MIHPDIHSLFSATLAFAAVVACGQSIDRLNPRRRPDGTRRRRAGINAGPNRGPLRMATGPGSYAAHDAEVRARLEAAYAARMAVAA